MSRNYIIFFACVAVVLIAAVIYQVQGNKRTAREISNIQSAGQLASTTTQPQTSNSTSTVAVDIIKQGTGPAAKSGDVVSVNYVGTLPDGTVFDSNNSTSSPFTFTLGAGQVIPGWDQGVLGMKVGEERRLTIPPDLAYGSTGVPGTIPPNSTLTFEVTLLKIGQ